MAFSFFLEVDVWATAKFDLRKPIASMRICGCGTPRVVAELSVNLRCPALVKEMSLCSCCSEVNLGQNAVPDNLPCLG